MPAALTNISKYYNGELVLDNVSLTIEDNAKIGLIGTNGCGKTTLLRILTGAEYPDRRTENDGIISISSKTTIGFLQQNSGLDSTKTVYEEMQSVFSRIFDIARKMRDIETKMSSGDNDKALADEYGKLLTQFEAADGWNTDVKIKTILVGLGFGANEWNRCVNGFSGGEKTRLAIARLLLVEPNLLILDEPTNHLDMKTVMWLEEYLSTYKYALLAVSHDRYFLDKTVSAIFEIERGRLTAYKGNYSTFTKQKAENVARQMKEYEAQQKEIAKLEDYIARNLVRASTTKMAQSRRTALEKIERIEKPLTSLKQMRLEFAKCADPPFDVLTVKEAQITVGEGQAKKTLAAPVSFELKRGERLAIVGENGTGKSTLLKILKSKTNLNGSIRWAENVKISYFDQESANLNPENTAIEEIHSRRPSMTDFEVRSLLGRVLLTGDEVFKKVNVLSGGERVKLCFAVLMLESGNVLILDEPTNHLDLDAKEALEAALCKYSGTIILVSHDRYLLSRVSTAFLELSADSALYFNCGFEEYSERSKQKQNEIEAEREQQKHEAAQKSGAAAYRSKEERAKQAQRRNRINLLERELEGLHESERALEAAMASEEVFSDYSLLQEKTAELERVKAEIDEKFDEWAELSEEI